MAQTLRVNGIISCSKLYFSMHFCLEVRDKFLIIISLPKKIQIYCLNGSYWTKLSFWRAKISTPLFPVIWHSHFWSKAFQSQMNLEFHNYYGDLAFAYPHQNHLKVKPLLEWFSQEDSSPQSFKMGKNPASKLAKSTHPSISQTVWLRTILITKSNDLHICLNKIY